MREGTASRAVLHAPAEALPTESQTGKRSRLRQGVFARVAVGATIGLMVALRLVALDSDAYPRLSWSSGLLTDEGFYIHNARNVVLFGHARTDEFNNYLIMPTLHFVQVAVFSLFGVGAIQARLISVVLSLLTLVLFFAALRRAFGRNVALVGTLFLGLDHVNLLYNRMALMDTPAAFLMVGAFYAFVRAVEKPRTDVSAAVSQTPFWWLACGLLLGLTFVTRGLTAFLLPAPFVLLWLQKQEEPTNPAGKAAWVRSFMALVGSLGVVLAVYFTLWYLPHRAEMTHANHYYVDHQLNPHSLEHLRQNVVHALSGDDRGMSPYLFRHTPVQFGLVLAGMAYWGLRGRKRVGSSQTRLSALFLGLWLLAAWALMAVISYSPSRYYVLFYPALAGIAALAFVHLREVGAAIAASPIARALLGGFLAYHGAEALLHHQSRATDLVLYGATALVVVLLVLWRAPERSYTGWGLRTAATATLLWATVNLYWTGDWMLHLSYAQRDADRWLAANLPPGSVLLGDASLGVCLNNRFVAVNVIPGLCNDRAPVERFAPAPRYIAILDGTMWKERWWQQHYPQYVAPDHQIHLFSRIEHWPVGVYALTMAPPLNPLP